MQDSTTLILKDLTSDICQQVTPIIPLMSEAVAFTNNSTPIVDASLIEKTILGSPAQCQWVTSLIMQARKSHPNVARYIDFVFLYLKNFHIVLYPAEEVKEKTKHAALYMPSRKMILFPDLRNLNDSFTLLEVVRHEIRHAVFNKLQAIYRKSLTSSSACDFPNRKINRAKIMQWLEDGDKRVEKFQDTLGGEFTGALPANIQEKITKLRESVKDEYHKYYQVETASLYTLDEIAMVEKSGIKLKAGEILNLGLLGIGKVYIQKITKPDANTIGLYFVFKDPLYAATYSILGARDQVKKAYHKEDYTFEREAYLHGSVPQKLIEVFYPELYKYANQLIETAYQTPVQYQAPIINYLNLDQLFEEEGLNLLKTPELFEAKLADTFIAWADYFVEMGKIEEAKIGLNTLVQKGYYVGEANLALARIAYDHDKNNTAAATYFKRAEKRFKHEKKEPPFSQEDYQKYADALSAEGRFKEASKPEKKVNECLNEECEFEINIKP